MSNYTMSPVVNGEKKQMIVKVGDTLPIGAEIDYEGSSVPNGWEEVDDPNTYSTDETRIGTFLGKPLYRKVIDFGALPNASEKNANHGIANLDMFTSINAISYNPTLKTFFYIPLASTSSNSSNIYILATLDQIRIGTGSDRSEFTKTYVTLEYTKTTD